MFGQRILYFTIWAKKYSYEKGIKQYTFEKTYPITDHMIFTETWKHVARA